jgi:beta-lactamase class D
MLCGPFSRGAGYAMFLPMRASFAVLSALLLAAACVPPGQAEAPEPEAPKAKVEAKPLRPKDRAAVQDGALEAHLAAESVNGVVAVLDSLTGELRCSNVDLCKKAFLPASTFKIAHTLAALEEHVVENAESPFKWDGKKYSVEAWNQDHTLRSAMADSCVPCYQGIARTLGEEREKAWLEKLDYGNHSVSGGLDLFWLEGGLRVTPIEQIDFLYRLDRAELPVSEASRKVTLDIITKSQTDTYVLRGKTGSACSPLTGWYVGYLESGDRRVYVAVLLDGKRSGADAAVSVSAAREPVALRALRAVTGLRID